MRLGLRARSFGGNEGGMLHTTPQHLASAPQSLRCVGLHLRTRAQPESATVVLPSGNIVALDAVPLADSRCRALAAADSFKSQACCYDTMGCSEPTIP